MLGKNHMRGFAARLCRIVAVPTVLLAASLTCAAELVPVADFFRNPSFADAVVSPSGKYVAATLKGGARGRRGLVVLNLQDLSKSKGLAGFADADIGNVHWVNDNRLVFSVIDLQAASADQYDSGLFVVDREGKEGARLLIKRRISDNDDAVPPTGSRLIANSRELSLFHHFYAPVRDGSDDIIIRRLNVNDDYDVIGTTLLRLNTVTGESHIITRDTPDSTMSWALDWKSEPRVAVTSYKGKTSLHWKATPEAAWTKVWERDSYGEKGRGFYPLIVDSRNMLYVVSYRGDEDFTSLSRIDMSKPDAEPQSVMSAAGFDFIGGIELNRKGGAQTVYFLTDARGSHWFDPALKAVQASVDAALPGTINEIDCGDCENPSLVVVRSWSDHQPNVYRLYDINAKTMVVIAQSRPWIKAPAMARREMKRFAARDGMSIPAHITHPNGVTGPAPMVVLVHGGPYKRGGEWAWDSDSQFLASRGYVVVEPEFRGSTGFGYKHFRAGWKQWGLTMQDDIADATQWAIKTGLADSKRICIAGASYGGYATLMGLIRYPELYRCGVDLIGVTDIDLLYTARWSDMSQIYKDYGLPALVGDREKDAAQLIATSPLKQAAKITQPLLMSYGGADWRVPIVHGVRLRDAVTPHNKNVEWLSYKEEGHGWILDTNETDFWTHAEAFLEKNLKAAP